MRTIRRTACAATLLALAAPLSLTHAQGLNLQLVPKIGAFTPLSGFTESTELKPALAYGIAAELTIPLMPFSIRANIDVAHEAELEQRGAAQARVGVITLTSIVGDVVLRPLPRTALTQPYFLGGAGMKRYEMDLETLAGGELSGIESDGSRVTFHVGGGLDVRVGALAFVLEFADYISTFTAASGESKLQNDLFGFVGFRVSMF